jgi:hypothetical protein
MRSVTELCSLFWVVKGGLETGPCGVAGDAGADLQGGDLRQISKGAAFGSPIRTLADSRKPVT